MLKNTEGQPTRPLASQATISAAEVLSLLVITRVTFDALETAGLGIDTILGSSNCLECTVSDLLTLEESAANLDDDQDHAAD